MSPVTSSEHIPVSNSHNPIQAGPAHHSKAVLNFLFSNTFLKIGARILPPPSRSGVDSIVLSQDWYLVCSSKVKVSCR